MPMACSQPLLRLSRWRYVVVLMTAVAALWMYIDRVCFSTLATPIQRSLKIDDESMSYVLGAFFFAYALFQVPAGALADRCGGDSPWRLASSVGRRPRRRPLSQTATMACSQFASFWGWPKRAYPAAARLIANWASPNERGTFSGIVSAGGRLGAGAPYLTACSPSPWLPGPRVRSSQGNWRAVFSSSEFADWWSPQPFGSWFETGRATPGWRTDYRNGPSPRLQRRCG